MSGLAETLVGAMAEDVSAPLEGGGFIVKLLKLRHANYPGREANGTLPLVVVGHDAMNEVAWRRWVREHGVAHYGAAITEKMLATGVDFREMKATAGIGRQLNQSQSAARRLHYLRRAETVLTAVEKWPSIYNVVVDEMSEQEMTLRQFVERIMNMPSPKELAAGAYTTLGDLLLPANSASRDGMVLPDY